MSQLFYYCEPGETEAKGPLEFKTIKAAVDASRLNSSAKLCREGNDSWVTYRAIHAHNYGTGHDLDTAYGMAVSEMRRAEQASAEAVAVEHEVKQLDPTPHNDAERTRGDLEGIIDVIGAIFMAVGGMATLVGVAVGLGGNAVGWIAMVSGLSSVVSGILFKGLAKIIGLLESILAELRKR